MLYLAALIAFTPQNQSAQYASELEYKILGWYGKGKYVVFEAETGGMGGLDPVIRMVKDSASNKQVKKWVDEDSGEGYLDKESASWIKANPKSGDGKTVFSFKGPYFTASKAPAKSRPIACGFKSGGQTYSLKLDQTNGPKGTDPNTGIVYQKAKYALKMKKGNGVWKTIHNDAKYDRNSQAYLIDKVVVSPDGKTVAVVIGQYNFGFFEGWNIAVERSLISWKL